jgi:hypothetical protein
MGLWVKSGHRIGFASCPLYPPKADIDERDRHVRFVPNGDICTAQKNQLHRTKKINPATDTDAAAFRRKALT